MRLRTFNTESYQILKTKKLVNSRVDVCQNDYPLDWYQEDFIPYAEEYMALPDRKMETVLPWMEKYISKAQAHFGDDLLLLAHYYMGGEIVKLIQKFGGEVADSYKLALMAEAMPEKKIIVESAVHFMAETISILKHDHQDVYITNPKSGCTMEILARDHMVEPALEALNARFGKENILPISYMNTSGRVKALTGEQGGAICTSSNVHHIFKWAMKKNKKILFIPDQNMGENVAAQLGIPPEKIAYWPAGGESAKFKAFDTPEKIKQFKDATLVLFQSYCGVHTHFSDKMVHYWQKEGFTTLVHPECLHKTLKEADGSGSTSYLWNHVLDDKFGTKKYAVGTEAHFVNNLIVEAAARGIEVVNVADAVVAGKKSQGCGCATMSRNDPPHLVALLDLMRQGKFSPTNLVMPGDVVNDDTGMRERLDLVGQAWVAKNARLALERMIQITEDANG